jgi:hypothetical protein
MKNHRAASAAPLTVVAEVREQSGVLLDSFHALRGAEGFTKQRGYTSCTCIH